MIDLTGLGSESKTSHANSDVFKHYASLMLRSNGITAVVDALLIFEY